MQSVHYKLLCSDLGRMYLLMKSSVMGLRSMVQLLEDNIKEKGILNILFMKHTLSFPCALYFISPTSHGRDFQENSRFQ